MSDDNKRTGGCLCGAVKFEVTLKGRDIHICHCNLCRKWAGGPSLSLMCEDGWKISGEESLTWFDSSEWAQRGFCNKCGSHLFGRLNEGDYRGVHVGALDDQSALEVGGHIFIDKKPSYYDFTDNAPRMTEEEFLAQFAEQDGS